MAYPAGVSGDAAAAAVAANAAYGTGLGSFRSSSFWITDGICVETAFLVYIAAGESPGRLALHEYRRVRNARMMS